MAEAQEHPEVTKARDMIRPVLEALDNSLAPAIERLQRLIERADGEARRAYGIEMQTLLEDAQKHRMMIIKPVIEIANAFPPKMIITGQEIVCVTLHDPPK